MVDQQVHPSKNMTKNTLAVSAFSFFLMLAVTDISRASNNVYDSLKFNRLYHSVNLRADTNPPLEVMQVIKAVIYSTNTFSIDAVANLYTPNALVADDEPPYSWNGPTAGIQWVNAVEQVCKDNHLTKLSCVIDHINVYQHSADNVYIIVPVSYTGDLPRNEKFYAEGAFTFVLRLVNGTWMIKSQVWTPSKGVK